MPDFYSTLSLLGLFRRWSENPIPVSVVWGLISWIWFMHYRNVRKVKLQDLWLWFPQFCCKIWSDKCSFHPQWEPWLHVYHIRRAAQPYRGRSPNHARFHFSSFSEIYIYNFSLTCCLVSFKSFFVLMLHHKTFFSFYFRHSSICFLQRKII